jgi:hypothetical protein
MKTNLKEKWIQFCMLLMVMSLSVSCGTKEMSVAKEEFKTYVDSCKQQYNYDPLKTEELGDYQIASGEMDFLQCTYSGIQTILTPNTAIPQVYESLLADHKKMTQKVSSKEMTRADRKKTTLALIESIRQKEQVESEKRTEELFKMADDMRKMEEIRRMEERILESQRHNFNTLRRSF